MKFRKTNPIWIGLGCLMVIGMAFTEVEAQTMTGNMSGAFGTSSCSSCGTGGAIASMSEGYEIQGMEYGNDCGDCGYSSCGNCAVRSGCFLEPLIRDVANVALTPVHWVASLLSCGTYADCGCGPVVKKKYCEPCDQCGNWIGCNYCGGTGCNHCAKQRAEVRMGTVMGGEMVENGEMVYGNDVLEGGEVEIKSEPLPANNAIPQVKPAPGKVIKSDSIPAGKNPSTIYVPVQKKQSQVLRIPQKKNVPVAKQAPTYIFVTPDGKEVPADQVKGFGQPGQASQFQIAVPNKIRQVNYENTSNFRGGNTLRSTYGK